MQFFPTTDEDFQYFRAQGYAGSINDMHFKAMGDLGYTGALTDRIHAYLVGTYGSYHEAMRDLRNGTSVFSLLSAYGINSLEPGLVLDFASEYYRTSGSDTTLASATTYTGASNGTMTDSDGLIKWKPHNLLNQSSVVFSAWNTQNVTFEDDATTAPDGVSLAQKIIPTATSSALHRVYRTHPSETRTQKFWAKSAGYNFVSVGSTIFNLSTGTVVSGGGSISDAGNGWYLCSEGAAVVTLVGATVFDNSTGAAFSGDTVSGVYLWGAHTYRSDLGGMVDNPERSDSYVPTTSAAVYLPRTGNHVYNGTAWVNEGLLLESEARTNLTVYSEDFTDASWVKTNTATLSLDAVGPDGVTNSAVTLVDSGATGTDKVRVVNTIVTTIGNPYTFSVFAKAAGLGFMQLSVGTDDVETSDEPTVNVNLTDGTFTEIAGNGTPTLNVGPTVEDYGNGWYRCSFSFNAGFTSFAVTVGPADSEAFGRFDTTLDLDGTSSILIYGAQFEAGSTPSSYIPTGGATVTRAAETLTVAAANMPWPTPVEVTGTELVTNGDFATGDLTGWENIGGDFVYDSGFVRDTGTSGTVFRQQLATQAGKVYKVEFDYLATSSGGTPSLDWEGVRVFYLSSWGSVGSRPSVLLLATQNDSFLGFNGASAVDYAIDNISVKEINPLSVSIQMDGRMTYADLDSSNAAQFVSWVADSSNGIILYRRDSANPNTGEAVFFQESANVSDSIFSGADTYSPDTNVPFSIASRHGSTFINGATDGVALTADTTPTALPDLSATDFDIGSTFMGNIGKVRVWADDLGDTGIVEATAPSLEPSLSLLFDGSSLSFTVTDWSE